MFKSKFEIKNLLGIDHINLESLVDSLVTLLNIVGRNATRNILTIISGRNIIQK